MKILCKLFGHPDRPHYHRSTDVVSCNGGCERHIEPYEILPCPRCGSTGFTGLVSNSESELKVENEPLLEKDFRIIVVCSKKVEGGCTKSVAIKLDSNYPGELIKEVDEVAQHGFKVVCDDSY